MSIILYTIQGGEVEVCDIMDDNIFSENDEMA